MELDNVPIPAEGGQPQVEGQSAVAEPTPAPAQTDGITPAPAQSADSVQTPEVRVPVVPQYDPTSYWQQQAQSAYQESLRLRQERDDFELQQVPDEEREVFQIKRELENMRRERETQQQQSAVQEWRTFCGQYVADPNSLHSMVDPLQMVGHAFGDQATRLKAQIDRVKQLESELAALRQVQGQPAGGPPVTPAGPGGPAPQQSLRTLSWADQDRLFERARMGLLKDNEIPPL